MSTKPLAAVFLAAVMFTGTAQSKTLDDLTSREMMEFNSCTLEKMSDDNVIRTSKDAVDKHNSNNPQDTVDEGWRALTELMLTTQIAHTLCAEEFGVEPKRLEIKEKVPQSPASPAS